MTDLTEQWKKGELPSGYYYIVVKQAEFPNRIDFYNSSATVWSYHSNDCVGEVLAPVPSYEEWKRILRYAGKYEFEYTSCVMDYENLKEENTKLKELLKECREVLDYAKDFAYHDPCCKCITKINQALGEDK